MVPAHSVPSKPLNQPGRPIDTVSPLRDRLPPSAPEFVAHSRPSNMVPAHNVPSSEPQNQADYSIDTASPLEVTAKPPLDWKLGAHDRSSNVIPAQDIPSESLHEAHRSIDPTSPPARASSPPLAHPSSVHCPPRNVLFFGETGVGKSSVVNMLIGKNTDAACISSGTQGCTFASKNYEATINGEQFVLWDTVGLNEGEKGETPSPVAEYNLQELMQNVEGGLSLLVYVIRGTRYREVVRINYELFHRAICGRKVPIVVVVTGLENEERMDAWWDDNEADLRKFGLVFGANACITASRGKVLKTGRHAFEDEYEESRRKLLELIPQNCSPEPILISVQRGEEISQLQSDAGLRRGSSAATFNRHDNHSNKHIWRKVLENLWRFLSEL
ncbi:hypothetical protein BDN67DRAFT_666559 [Paxillus ammoniavirescens]|nr:hypothetical protein BDN67DRAFT_666559 [Paxillus ammoniavirescens]